MPLRYALFGDESTLPRMQEMLHGQAVLSVVASNRPQATGLAGNGAVVVQPPRAAPEFAAFVDALRGSRPDMILCFSYSMILPPEVLALPARGGINIHGALLPQYRGANVLNWVLIEGARVTGVTAHHMAPQVDAGDIILQQRVDVADADTAVTLKARLDAVGFEMLERICDAVARGESLPRFPQDPAQARHYKRRRPEDGRIDWERSDVEIYNLVRALVSPWPGAFYFDSQGRKVIVDRYLTLDKVRELREQHGR